MNTEQKAIITINASKNIMGIFLGPFLTVYFIKTSQDSLLTISTYYILAFFILAIGTILVAVIVNRKYRIEMYRFGVVVNFIYMMSIVILQSKIVNYLPIIAILYGISMATYWYPYNMFISNKIENKERTKFTVLNSTISSIIGVFAPIILGTIITVSDFRLTSVIIAIISGIVIILSFFIKTEKDYKLPPVEYKETWKYLIKYKATRKTLFTQFLIGLTASDGALNILTTVIIFESFKTDLNLGIITSIATILKILYLRLYQKKFSGKKDKALIILSSFIPSLSLLLLIFLKTNITLVLYNICFTVFTGLLLLIAEVRMFNISNSNLIDEDKQVEFLAFRELVLNFGRITSYLLVIVLIITNIKNSLNILLIVLTLLIIYMGYNVSRLNKYEKVK